MLPYSKSPKSLNVDIPVITETGEARNNVIVNSANIVIACGGEDAGTASEVALAIRAGKPVVLLAAGKTAIDLFRYIEPKVLIADSPAECGEIAKQLLNL